MYQFISSIVTGNDNDNMNTYEILLVSHLSQALLTNVTRLNQKKATKIENQKKKKANDFSFEDETNDNNENKENKEKDEEEEDMNKEYLLQTEIIGAMNSILHTTSTDDDTRVRVFNGLLPSQTAFSSVHLLDSFDSSSSSSSSSLSSSAFSFSISKIMYYHHSINLLCSTLLGRESGRILQQTITRLPIRILTNALVNTFNPHVLYPLLHLFLLLHADRTGNDEMVKLIFQKMHRITSWLYNNIVSQTKQERQSNTSFRSDMNSEDVTTYRLEMMEDTSDLVIVERTKCILFRVLVPLLNLFTPFYDPLNDPTFPMQSLPLIESGDISVADAMRAGSRLSSIATHLYDISNSKKWFSIRKEPLNMEERKMLQCCATTTTFGTKGKAKALSASVRRKLSRVQSDRSGRTLNEMVMEENQTIQHLLLNPMEHFNNLMSRYVNFSNKKKCCGRIFWKNFFCLHNFLFTQFFVSNLLFSTISIMLHPVVVLLIFFFKSVRCKMEPVRWVCLN